jgi:hypothetical protein
MPDSSFKLDLLGLYGRFIERKYDIYQEEKFRVRADNVVAIEQRERDLKSMRGDHQLLALKLLFNEEQLALFKNNIDYTFSAEELTRIGIVQVNCEGKPQFIHRTFSEYYVADCLFKHLTKWNNSSQEIQTFILTYILQEEECRVIRLFIDAFLSRSKPSDEVLNHYGSRIHDLGRGYVLILHKAAVESNVYIMAFLLDCLQAATGRIRFTEILRPRIQCERFCVEDHFVQFCKDGSPKPLIGKYFSLQCPGHLERIARNLSKEILFDEYLQGEFIWHVATEQGKLDVLQEIWEWAKMN